METWRLGLKVNRIHGYSSRIIPTEGEWKSRVQAVAAAVRHLEKTQRLTIDDSKLTHDDFLTNDIYLVSRQMVNGIS
jgi:hypothetical protein